jgi:hypothetical protein
MAPACLAALAEVATHTHNVWETAAWRADPIAYQAALREALPGLYRSLRPDA